MLNNSHGIAVKYETLLHPADYNLVNKELGGGHRYTTQDLLPHSNAYKSIYII